MFAPFTEDDIASTSPLVAESYPNVADHILEPALDIFLILDGFIKLLYSSNVIEVLFTSLNAPTASIASCLFFLISEVSTPNISRTSRISSMIWLRISGIDINTIPIIPATAKAPPAIDPIPDAVKRLATVINKSGKALRRPAIILSDNVGFSETVPKIFLQSSIPMIKLVINDINGIAFDIDLTLHFSLNLAISSAFFAIILVNLSSISLEIFSEFFLNTLPNNLDTFSLLKSFLSVSASLPFAFFVNVSIPSASFPPFS